MGKIKIPKPAKPKPPKKIDIKPLKNTFKKVGNTIKKVGKSVGSKLGASKSKGGKSGGGKSGGNGGVIVPISNASISNECAGFKPSGNIFKDSLTNATCLQEQLVGPTYPYWKNIRSPSELGMSDKGSISVMAKDVAGLINYVEVLVTGKGKASKTGKPLGNKFFLKTGAKCMDDKKNLQDRYVYVNNVPLGNVPFISSGMGTNFKELKGLLPGTMSNLNSINPIEVIQGFSAGATPPCQKITLQTISTDNKVSKETHYMTTLDLQSMDPCNFMDGKNPITKKKCKQAFGNMNNYYSNEYYNDDEYYTHDEEYYDSSSDDDSDDSESEKEDNDSSFLSLPKDPIVQIYLACLGILGIYILYRIMMKSKK
jgi:hypothetical protein